VNQIDEFACYQLDRVSHYLINLECLFVHANDAGLSSIDWEGSKLRVKTLDRSLDSITRMEYQEGTFNQWEYIDSEKSVPKWIQCTFLEFTLEENDVDFDLATRPSVRAVNSRTASPIDNFRVGSPIMTVDQRTSIPDGHQVLHLWHRHLNVHRVLNKIVRTLNGRLLSEVYGRLCY